VLLPALLLRGACRPPSGTVPAAVQTWVFEMAGPLILSYRLEVGAR
jgi:hypothetical protein